MVTITGQWHITLLGELRAEQNDRSITRFRTHKTGLLLAYLAFYTDRLHPRDVLAEMLWPDGDLETTRGSFRTALNSLRRQLEPPGTPAGHVLVADRYHVSLRSETVVTDAGLFQQEVRAARERSDPAVRAEHLARAVEAYTGELLPGYYEEWVAVERRRLEESYTSALRRLLEQAESAGDIPAALRYAERLVAADPTLEEAHVMFMRLFHRAGRPGDALRQYNTLERILDAQLGAKPALEARALAGEIREGLGRKGSAPLRHRVARASPPPARPPASSRRADSTVPGFIPLSLMPFFGRDAEIERLSGMLEQSVGLVGRAGQAPAAPVRLLTVFGPGGSGKTRLALEVARRCNQAFRGAVWFVSLAELSEAEAIPDALFDAMRLSRSSSAPWSAEIRSALRDRPALIVLDNLEHLVEGARRIVLDLISQSPRLVCLATSRIRLDIDGERLFPLAPLPLPAAEEISPRDLMECPSIKLFLDRAQAVRADFQLTPQNAPDVAELCRRLEGLPLAVELAASWVQTLTPRQMLKRTQERLSLTTRRRHGPEERHGSLRAAIDWSYRLLTGEMQQLFRRLSVFRGGWSAAGAAAICLDDAHGAHSQQALREREQAMLRDLTLLAESSLILTEEISLESGPEIRFGMLETLREYGMELLAPEEKHLVEERHAGYFAALAEQYDANNSSRNRDRLDADLDNLRTALLWNASAPGRGEQALRLAVSMYKLWVWWGHNVEGLQWIERFLHCAAQNTALEADALNAAGNLCCYMGDGPACFEYQQRHLAVRRAMGDKIGAARALCNMGNALVILDRAAEAVPLHEEGFQTLLAAGATDRVPAAMLNLASSIRSAGDLERSAALYYEAITALEGIGHWSGLTSGYMELASLSREAGDTAQARALYEKALETWLAAGYADSEPGIVTTRRIQAALAELERASER